MATIIPRKHKDGSTGYDAQLVMKLSDKVVHRKTGTFDRKQAASAWLEKREKELAKPGGIEGTKWPAAGLMDWSPTPLFRWLPGR